mmetsp:Transcript_20518/g.26540  ORF Transcript_20518/g.26540 Transcript_20518/m.26540 type:complete len:428 (+) Transcript_20518:115-1398(+)|eukprot:CAMPEP_0116057738 /NCGR_PEP_ID=MMETSP0322-20121206/4786_1 /TAXON_ID=163516 /ORGANISM="Leptocylindrus danicus var. apora, Strain B651" /LENGTH=427 /DNA_ID=CAMNT_0003541799 /DNA_START=50 /DNA_END=1333 /DNA_ORIENTATION=+
MSSRYDRNDPYRSSRGSSRRRSRSRSRSGSRDRGDGQKSYRNVNDEIPPPIAGTSAAAAAQLMPPLATGMPNLLMQAQISQVEKINRELFVGNIPPALNDVLLKEFMAGAMKRTGLCAPNATPILNVRISPKFAFMECMSVHDANQALNLNGIPFMGIALRVSRPSKYSGPYVPSQTWQQLTGQPLPPGCNPVPENGPPGEGEKIDRELFVGNTTPEMNEEGIKDFLGKALEQVGLSNGGNPILNCRMSGKYAFIELRTIEETKRALNLNNIPYLGVNLRIGRPSKWNGIPTPHGNWEDIIAKFMSGELQLPQAGLGGTNNNAEVIVGATETKVVVLENMLTKEDLESNEEYEEIVEDTREECSSFGTLIKIEIPRSGVGVGKIFLEYATSEDAGKAIAALKGRTFDGRKVTAEYFPEEKFTKGEYH